MENHFYIHCRVTPKKQHNIELSAFNNIK